MIAVKSGYYFVLMPKAYIDSFKANITETGLFVHINNKDYILYKGTNNKDALVIDHIIDTRHLKVNKIDNYKTSKRGALKK